MQRGIRVGVEAFLAGLDGLGLHFDEQVGNSLACVDCHVGDRLTERQVGLHRAHAGDVAAHVLGDCERRRVVLRTTNLQAGRDAELSHFQLVVGRVQALQRDHRAGVGVY